MEIKDEASYAGSCISIFSLLELWHPQVNREITEDWQSRQEMVEPWHFLLVFLLRPNEKVVWDTFCFCFFVAFFSLEPFYAHIYTVHLEHGDNFLGVKSIRREEKDSLLEYTYSIQIVWHVRHSCGFYLFLIAITTFLTETHHGYQVSSLWSSLKAVGYEVSVRLFSPAQPHFLCLWALLKPCIWSKQNGINATSFTGPFIHSYMFGCAIHASGIVLDIGDREETKLNPSL